MLKTAMIENAMFSGLTGVVLIFGAAWLDTWLGAPGWLLAALGAGLIGYAAFLVTTARNPRWMRFGGTNAVVGDVAWVLGAAALILVTDALTTKGEIALATVSAIVAAFAALQWIGLRRIAASG